MVDTEALSYPTLLLQINQVLELNIIKYYSSLRATSIRKGFKETEVNLDRVRNNFRGSSQHMLSPLSCPPSTRVYLYS